VHPSNLMRMIRELGVRVPAPARGRGGRGRGGLGGA
jgi:hypothetical protein